MRLLLAEDDHFLADGLSMVLRDNGYAIDVVSSGLDAEGALNQGPYDLLILDLGLPKLDGLELLKRMRAKGQSIPVLVVTARDRLEDRIRGLDLGASDYITKPFEVPELEARVRALLRKDQWANLTKVVYGPLHFDTVNRTATVLGNALNLSARELAILEILLQRVGRVVSKEQLTDQLSSWDEEVTANAVGINIHRLRKKLEQYGLTINAARGLGYRLEKSS